MKPISFNFSKKYRSKIFLFLQKISIKSLQWIIQIIVFLHFNFQDKQ